MCVVKDKETSSKLADAFRQSEWTIGFKSSGLDDHRRTISSPAEDHSFVSILVNDNKDGQCTAVRPSMVTGSDHSEAQSGSGEKGGQISYDEAVLTSSSSSGAPFWYQVVVLCRRMLLNWVRNPVMLASEIIQYVFMSVFVGKSMS